MTFHLPHECLVGRQQREAHGFRQGDVAGRAPLADQRFRDAEASRTFPQVIRGDIIFSLSTRAEAPGTAG